jgi:hypothetical protein
VSLFFFLFCSDFVFCIWFLVFNFNIDLVLVLVFLVVLVTVVGPVAVIAVGSETVIGYVARSVVAPVRCTSLGVFAVFVVALVGMLVSVPVVGSLSCSPQLRCLPSSLRCRPLLRLNCLGVSVVFQHLMCLLMLERSFFFLGSGVLLPLSTLT